MLLNKNIKNGCRHCGENILEFLERKKENARYLIKYIDEPIINQTIPPSSFFREMEDYKSQIMKIVVLDGYAANPGDLSWDELKALGECTIYERTSPEEVLERAAGAEILLTNKVVLNAEIIAALPELKYIGVLATGYNIVDVTAAKEHGIIVTNIPAYSTDSVAQMVFAHILNIAQQVQHYTDEIRTGRWSNSPDFCFGILRSSSFVERK